MKADKAITEKDKCGFMQDLFGNQKLRKKPQRHKVTGLHSAYSVFLCDLSVSVFQKTLTGINPVSLQAPLFFQIPVRIACSIVQVQRRLYCKQFQLV